MEKRRRIIEVKVQTKSRRREVIPTAAGAFTLKVLSAPAKGQANREVIRLLAGHFHIPLSRVRIVRGAGSSRKWVALEE